MAARDVLNLDKALAPRLIRCLYTLALILIAVMVILGLVRGISTMTRQPPGPRPAIANNAAPAQPAPDATPTQPPGPGMMNGPRGAMMIPGQRAYMIGPAQRRMMMMRRFGPRPMGTFGIGRNPVLAGLWIILGTLLRGAIMLLVVRILAEMGLAILAMPRRSES